ncbi:MAG TPA: hypothetical protein VKW76_07590 [Candidatus Binatia bacterium]|nr:hypothetical protein [Candidatus Binatia bacterium]
MLRVLRVLVALAAAAVAAVPARAGRILYVTESSQSRIDGFCINPDGSLVPAPAVQAPTSGGDLRRVIVGTAPDGTARALYVAEADRVESFPIHADGSLGPAVFKFVTDPRDVAVWSEQNRLYVPDNTPGKKRIIAFPLDPATGVLVPGQSSPSIVKESAAALLEGMAFTPGRLYVSSDDQLTNIWVDVFFLDASGNITTSNGTIDCAEVNGKVPKVCRRVIPGGARVIALSPDASILYADLEFARQLGTYAIAPDGTFPLVPKTKIGKKCAENPGSDACFKRVKPTSRTAPHASYLSILVHRSAAFGSVFGKGRIDAYRLKADGRLRRVVSLATPDDLRLSPVRMTASDTVLYVATGLFDEVRAYPLSRKTGALASSSPFSATNQQTGSFPNDVAIAVLSGPCG